ncbi:MAG: lactonase family protein [Bacteroidetes bacterium]|nr:lactonase family protein [Bacteroidota bacterium]
MKKMLCSFFLFLVSFAFAQKNSEDHYLLVGTYTSGKSEGVYVYKFNSQNGDFSYVSTAKNVSNPSYLVVSPDEKHVFAVNENHNNEQNGGEITSFSFDKKTGQLTQLNKQPSAGNDPCYISVDKSGKFVIAGNYSSGTASVLPVKKDGSLDAPVSVVQHEGSGVNSERQEGPHVHCTVLSKDNNYVFITDLGIDKIMIYSFDSKKGKLSPAPTPYIETEPGTGPRHFEFHPNNKFAYLLEELSGGISVYAYKGKGQLDLLQNISALPPDYIGPVGSADIHVSTDGKFLYASNRGESNTIAIFSINQQNGELTLVGHQSTMGKTPRNFNFDPSGNFLLAANQNSDNIVIFKRDKATGLLTDTGKRIEVEKPVCIKWIK